MPACRCSTYPWTRPFNFHYANAYEVPDTEDSSNISKVTAPTTTAAVEGAAAGTVAGGSGASGGGKAPDTATNIDTTAQGNHLQQDIQHRHHKIVIDTVRCAHMEFGEGQPGKPVWQDLDYAKLVPYSRLVRYDISLQ